MNKSGLYVHIPFCAKKCYYCDFTSYVGKNEEIEKYLDFLEKEIRMYIKSKTEVSSIFIGGGTPSLLTVGQLKKLFTIIDKYFYLENKGSDSKIEFTMECNPGTLTIEKLELMKKMGVNRLSIGLQSTHDKHLEFMGRIHNYKEFEESYNFARKVGFDNINVDLIFAFQGQTFEEWKDTVDKIVALKPEHISAYSLIIEEGTKFFDLYEKGQLDEIDEDLYVKMYRYIIERLKENSYKQYEISNYAKSDCECKHNILYWDCKEYYGFGLGASSYLQSTRNTNTKNMKEYIDKLEDGCMPIVFSEKLGYKDKYNEKMMLGLRKIDGIELDTIFSLLDDCDREKIESKIEKYISQEYIKLKTIDNNIKKISLTQSGVEISNTILADLML